MTGDIHPDGQEINNKAGRELDECLAELTMVLKTIGVDELSFEDDHHYHMLRSDSVNAWQIHTFCSHIRQMYREIVTNPQADGRP